VRTRQDDVIYMRDENKIRRAARLHALSTTVAGRREITRMYQSIYLKRGYVPYTKMIEAILVAEFQQDAEPAKRD